MRRNLSPACRWRPCYLPEKMQNFSFWGTSSILSVRQGREAPAPARDRRPCPVLKAPQGPPHPEPPAQPHAGEPCSSRNENDVISTIRFHGQMPPEEQAQVPWGSGLSGFQSFPTAPKEWPDEGRSGPALPRANRTHRRVLIFVCVSSQGWGSVSAQHTPRLEERKAKAVGLKTLFTEAVFVWWDRILTV